MKLEKVIEILENDYSFFSSPYTSDLSKAQRVGIEAIKELQWLRSCQASNAHELLPGETKD
ncbi:hypothetical protein ES703_125889 [subsurface metagenome]